MTSRTGPANDPKDKRPVKGESSRPVNSRLIPPQPEGWGLGDGVVVDGKNTRAQRREAEGKSPKEGGWKPPGNVARTASAEARTLGARGGVLTQYITNTLQGNGQRT
jgi:hypothetical protein